MSPAEFREHSGFNQRLHRSIGTCLRLRRTSGRSSITRGPGHRQRRVQNQADSGFLHTIQLRAPLRIQQDDQQQSQNQQPRDQQQSSRNALEESRIPQRYSNRQRCNDRKSANEQQNADGRFGEVEFGRLERLRFDLSPCRGDFIHPRSQAPSWERRSPKLRCACYSDERRTISSQGRRTSGMRVSRLEPCNMSEVQLIHRDASG